MALLENFNRLTANDTFEAWLLKTNEMIDLFREDAVTANTNGANTFGHGRIIGGFFSNTLIAHEELRGGDLFDGNSANLNIVSNTIFTDAADWVEIQNDLAVVGNVAIGADTDNTSFFSQKLVVNGAILTTNTSEEGGNLYFGNTDNSITTISNGNMEIRTTSTLELVTGTEERIRVDATSGNVSIGASQDPQHTVHVHANTDTPAIQFTTDITGKTATDGTLIAVSNSDSSLLISNREDSYIAIDTNDTERARVAANGNIGINTETPEEKLHVDGNIHVSGGDRTIFNRDTNYLAFGTDNTEWTRIAANGNIGINETSPEEKLHVDGNIHLSGDDRTIYNRSNNFLALGTNNLERARISAGGNVSINMTDTLHQLSVNGDVLITDDDASATIYLGNTDNSITKTAGGNTSVVTTHNMRLFTDSAERLNISNVGDIAFYSTDGLNQKLYWDATNEVLGVNTASPQMNVALDVIGTVKATDLNVDNEVIADVVTIESELRSTSDLQITSNVIFQEAAVAQSDLTVEGAVTISAANLIYKLIPDNYDDLIPSAVSGDLLGNTSNRWDGFFNDLDTETLVVSSNVTVQDTLTVQNLTVAGNGDLSLPSTVAFTGVTEFENITVNGTANIVSLEVESLTTNAAALVGAGGIVESTTPTVIDSFDKDISKGFKYIVHGENAADSTSAYAVEINCSHNGTTVFYTRFGEVSNNFDVDLIPVINGNNVELQATCPNANNTSGTHIFNILRIETR